MTGKSPFSALPVQTTRRVAMAGLAAHWDQLQVALMPQHEHQKTWLSGGAEF